MPRRSPVRALAAAAALLLAACGREPSVPTSRDVVIDLSPRFQVGTVAGAPIRRIRVVAYERFFDGEVTTLEPFDTTVVTVDPDRLAWTVNVLFPPPSDTIEVVAEIELLGADGSVQWSARTEPIPVVGTRPATVDGPTLGRGPLSNLGVFSLNLFLNRAQLVEGDSTFSTASIASNDDPTVPYYASLDTAIATVDQAGKVLTKRDGQARIVLAAGFLADTVVLDVVQRAAAVDVTQDSLTIAPRGQAQFTATVRDPRGATIGPNAPGGGLSWEIANGQVASNQGGGLFIGTSTGRTTVTARSTQDQVVVGTAILRVQ